MPVPATGSRSTSRRPRSPSVARASTWRSPCAVAAARCCRRATSSPDVVHLGELGPRRHGRGVRGVLPRCSRPRARGAPRRGPARERRRGPARRRGQGARGELAARRRRLLRRGREGGRSRRSPVPTRRTPVPRPRTSPRSSARRRPGSPSSSPPRAVTTSSWPGRRASARRCSPSGFPGCCRSSTRRRDGESRDPLAARASGDDVRLSPVRRSWRRTTARRSRGRRRRRRRRQARGDHPGPPRGALPRRDPGVPRRCSSRCASRSRRGGCRSHGPTGR